MAKYGCPVHLPSVIMHVLSAVVSDAQAATGACILQDASIFLQLCQDLLHFMSCIEA